MGGSGELSGKIAIVTGGSKGIGRAVARVLAEQGASLILVGRGSGALAAVAEDLRALKVGVHVVAGDVGDPATAHAARAMAIDRCGRIDILANIAGVFPTALVTQTTDALFSETISSNLTGTFNMSRAVLPAMFEQRAGVIVNMSSMAARFPTPGLSVYGASKAAIEAFTRSIAAEAAPWVRVNAVAAGPTLTETVEALMASDTTGAVASVTQGLPLKRLGLPREIAEAVLFLASPRASFITGQILHVNGGGIMA